MIFALTVFAADTPFEFESPAQQAQYQRLLEELRCLVCQNQSLADSHADLAQDLRDEVYSMLGEGKTNDEIREFMVARYGDFVLYKPPIKSSTTLLWFGPFILIFLAGFAVWRAVTRQKKAPQDLTEQEREFVEKLRNETPTSKEDSLQAKLRANDSNRDAPPIKPGNEP
jgi:cytochrome c-type biogenesis protein CcmH